MGFEYFSVMARDHQWTRTSSQSTQIFPWLGKPDYNLTTDLADEAIDHIISSTQKRQTSRYKYTK